MQLRTQLGEAFEKQQKSEHDREAVEMKVLEVSVGVSSLVLLTIPSSLAERHRLGNFYMAMYLLCAQLREEITVKSQEIDRESRRKVKLEKDLKAVQVCMIILFSTSEKAQRCKIPSSLVPVYPDPSRIREWSWMRLYPNSISNKKSIGANSGNSGKV